MMKVIFSDKRIVRRPDTYNLSANICCVSLWSLRTSFKRSPIISFTSTEV